MNRRILTAALFVLMLLSMTACKKKAEQTEPIEIYETTEVTETVAPEATETAEETEESLSAPETTAPPVEDDKPENNTGTPSSGKNNAAGNNSSGNNTTGNNTTGNNSSGNNSSSGNGASSGNASSSGDDSSDKTEETEPTKPNLEDNVQMGVVEGVDDGGLEDFEPENEPAQPTQPIPTQPTQPVPSTPTGSNVLGDNFDITALTYESYNAMTGEQQKAVIDLFGSPDDFMVWYKAVEAAYKAQHPDIEIGSDGSINAGNLGG